jgi:hypothetical protein
MALIAASRVSQSASDTLSPSSASAG